MDSKKSNKIRDIVRLQQILKKWRKLANSSKTTSSSSSSRKTIKFLKRTLSSSDYSNIRGDVSSNNVVPKGYLAVCVGEELKRFVIPTEYLGHHAFHILLREAEEEFGFQQTGVLRIPCEVSVFENILKMVEEKDHFLVQECRFSMDEKVQCCSSKSQRTQHSHHPQSPMCR
ncbi:auxin-responsive protein SAUR71-like [Quercus lobata]|uniref:SAUR family protein n=1 Tax=Quercus lobata TaxID=97700 RepID=A0A7N2N383_QUELO|nr:auxin-responsive protein SAUR71-like [Quercus lobata]